MKRLTMFMSQYQVLWLVWMSAGTPLMLAGFLLDVVFTTLRNLYAEWHWEWKGELTEWFSRFGERHRKRLHSLGSKPERGQ